ncbi:MAG: heparinase II/III family protein [Acidobacteria bacterium]|nr:heparinase II/III family protein [Acidobacteriota bacterium]
MFRHLLVSVLLTSGAWAQVEQPLRTLRQGHPRLIALDSDIQRIRGAIKTDPLAKELYRRLTEEGDRLESAPPVEHRLIGPRLLDQSRRCLSRIYTLALLYRLDGNPKHLARAVKELRTAAEFPDWNPSHYLDTAEMTHALAIGYDWLYPALTPDDRAVIRRAIVEKGLDTALPIYQQQRSWSRAVHNWNQVCNGGIGIGALAVAEDEPEKAARILQYAVKSIPLAMASYAPGGGWNEGPGYWHYATRYNVYFLAALESALGTDFGLSAIPGFSQAGHFRVSFSSPAGKTFNYADAGSSLERAAEMFWLARKFKEPVYTWQQRTLLAESKTAEALDLVWLETAARSPQQAGWPLDAYYKGVDVAFLRSSWDDPNAIFVGVKGGDNKANHSHADLGSFVLDAGGTRWAMDFGGDNYNLPRYFGNLRWTYYRLRTESHNTLLIDNENQDPKAAATILETRFTPDSSSIRIDLAKAWPGRVQKLERTVTLAGRKRVLIQDKLEAERPVDALWGMVTDAEVTLKGRTAELSKNGWKLLAEIRSPDGARFDTVSTAPPAPQNQNAGTRKLVVRLPEKVRQLDLRVALTPARN